MPIIAWITDAKIKAAIVPTTNFVKRLNKKVIDAFPLLLMLGLLLLQGACQVHLGVF